MNDFLFILAVVILELLMFLVTMVGFCISTFLGIVLFLYQLATILLIVASW